MQYDLSPAEIDQLLEECQQNLGYRFVDCELLKSCLTHTSAAKTRMDSNERLEFLGDAILGSLVCEKLFAQFPNAPEGELTRIKSAVVSPIPVPDWRGKKASTASSLSAKDLP